MDEDKKRKVTDALLCYFSKNSKKETMNNHNTKTTKEECDDNMTTEEKKKDDAMMMMMKHEEEDEEDVKTRQRKTCILREHYVTHNRRIGEKKKEIKKALRLLESNDEALYEERDGIKRYIEENSSKVWLRKDGYLWKENGNTYSWNGIDATNKIIWKDEYKVGSLPGITRPPWSSRITGTIAPPLEDWPDERYPFGIIDEQKDLK